MPSEQSRRVVVGLVHPGSMGSAVGACAAASASVECVYWASAGRSKASVERARADGLADAGTLQQLATSCDIIISVCPPDKAAATASDVMAAGFSGLYVDANAVAPATARLMAEQCLSAGARGFVDGGLTGGPPRSSSSGTKLFLSGEAALVAEVRACFESTFLSAVPVAREEVGAASAVKACFAAWTKGQTALLQNIVSLSVAEGVQPDLFDLWQSSIGDAHVERSLNGIKGSAGKAWRWVGEMEELEKAFVDVGLPGGFHAGAADLFSRMTQYKDLSADDAPDALEVTEALLLAANKAKL
jgi:3-hydroxyisobutyrate dehydrogenase-like beta-hydroxyacid dehydrogenase